MMAFTCDSCTAISIATLPGNAVPTHEGTEDIERRIWTDDKEIAWLPIQVTRKRFEDMPTNISQAASEAYACYSIGSYRAATLLARAVVEATAKDNGHNKGALVAKISAMEQARLISPNLAEAAHEIRLMGNAAAHGDFMEAITEQDCDDLLDFMSSILEEIYQRPANLARRKEQRQRREQRAESVEVF